MARRAAAGKRAPTRATGPRGPAGTWPAALGRRTMRAFGLARGALFVWLDAALQLRQEVLDLLRAEPPLAARGPVGLQIPHIRPPANSPERDAKRLRRLRGRQPQRAPAECFHERISAFLRRFERVVQQLHNSGMGSRREMAAGGRRTPGPSLLSGLHLSRSIVAGGGQCGAELCARAHTKLSVDQGRWGCWIFLSQNRGSRERMGQ